MDNDTKIETVVEYALKQVGKPYSYNADPPNSWDCSKLTAAAWAQVGIKLTPYTYEQVKELNTAVLSGVSPNNNANLQPGDLLFYFKNSAHHVSMYIGDNKVVESSSPATGVRVTNTWTSWNIQHFSQAGRPNKIGEYGGGGTGPGSPGGNNEEDKNLIGTSEVRKIKNNSVGKSLVVGTPQNGRFAVVNLTTESVWLSASAGLSVNPQLFVKAKVIVPGDQYEISKIIPEANGTYEILIESDYVQSKEQAELVLRMISRSISNPTKSINVKIFGNPLIQLGDVVKFNFFTNKIQSGPEDFYVVSKIQQDYSDGLSTSLTLKPLTQSVSVV
jgi:hypothetical protein